MMKNKIRFIVRSKQLHFDDNKKYNGLNI